MKPKVRWAKDDEFWVETDSIATFKLSEVSAIKLAEWPPETFGALFTHGVEIVVGGLVLKHRLKDAEEAAATYEALKSLFLDPQPFIVEEPKPPAKLGICAALARCGVSSFDDIRLASPSKLAEIASAIGEYAEASEAIAVGLQEIKDGKSVSLETLRDAIDDAMSGSDVDDEEAE